MPANITFKDLSHYDISNIVLISYITGKVDINEYLRKMNQANEELIKLWEESK